MAAPHPPLTADETQDSQRFLFRLMLLSVAAAVVTIVLKVIAAAVTGSVGFLSDALESGVNLVAALVGLWSIRLAAQPPDPEHHFGHGKAEYLSAAVEGALIFVAAIAIGWTAIGRILDPQPIEQPGIGLLLSTLASVVNLVVGFVLVRQGRRHRSIAVEADGRHLLTDVVTSIGVLVGIGLVAIFEWHVLDPIVALLVGVNILVTGSHLLNRSVTGLLDAAIPPEQMAEIKEVLDEIRQREPVDFHDLRSRESGRQRFVYVHLLTPDAWTVKRAHDLANEVSLAIDAALPGTRTFVHTEPITDPSSYDHALAPTDRVAPDDPGPADHAPDAPHRPA